LVVDSESTDRTRELAARFTEELHVLPWKGFAAQKNQALQWARHRWVLSVDADEVVSPALVDEIRGLFLNRGLEKVAAFSIPRKTIHFGRWIRYGGWYPNRLVRFFDKTRGQWKGEELHESWVTTGEVQRLSQDLLHFSFSDLSDQVNRNNRYSTLGALKLRREGAKFSHRRLFTKPLFKFLETYLVKRGFLDGYPGFIISISAAYSVFLKWAKLWEIENAEEN
jgi:glycosyltransferase involved in cell wall biosynthesis